MELGNGFQLECLNGEKREKYALYLMRDQQKKWYQTLNDGSEEEQRKVLKEMAKAPREYFRYDDLDLCYMITDWSISLRGVCKERYSNFLYVILDAYVQQGRCFHCAVEVAKILCKSTFYRTNTWIVDWNKMAFMVKDPLPKESELDEEEKEILREMREEAPDLFMVPLDEVRIGDWDCEEEDYDA